MRNILLIALYSVMVAGIIVSIVGDLRGRTPPIWASVASIGATVWLIVKIAQVVLAK